MRRCIFAEVTKIYAVMYYTPNLFTYNQPGTASRKPYRGTPSRPEIFYTDRVYARLTMAGRTVAEFTRDRVTNFSALLAMLRALVPGCRGLARLTVRNMTRGWSLERPLMLYPDEGAASSRSSDASRYLSH